MKILRNKKLVRVLALAQLLFFAESIFLPDYAWALTSGPFQPEYTSYEEPGSTDMVNLLTGDFSFSLPIMEVPGPEGGFSLPLSYHAGIGPEQEASWVGLGWTLNPGAITRTVNGYPDDANGESHSITKKDLTGVRGWTSSVLGFGEVGWNTQQGYYGTISLFGLADISYDNNGISGVGIAGVNISSSGLSFSAEKFFMAAMTIVPVAGEAMSNSIGLTKQMVSGSNLAGMAAGNALVSSFLPSSMNAPDLGAWQYSKKVEQGFLHEDYWIWLDQTRTEKMYGVLNLGNANLSSYTGTDALAALSLSVNGTTTPIKYFPRNTYNSFFGSASDMVQNINSGSSYYQVDNPSLLAVDNYSVKAPGISGGISPYRLDIGSVSMPREMSPNHDRLSTVGYTNYKVPFIYDGSPTNAYYHHVGSASSIASPTFYFGATNNNYVVNNTWNSVLNLNDIILQNQRVSPTTPNFRIAKENHVEWISNSDILNEATRTAVGFQDFLTDSARTNFRNAVSVLVPYQSSLFYVSMPSFATTIPINPDDIVSFSIGQPVDLNLTVHPTGQPDYLANVNGAVVSNVGSDFITVSSGSLTAYIGLVVDIELVLHNIQDISKAIGGYAITNASGVTYHFAIPVYDYEQFTMMRDLSDPNNKFTTLNRIGAFVNTWLLTAITGPDYIDRGPGGTPNGVVDDTDWGYWVKLNYGIHSTNYQWRIPFTGEKTDPDNTSSTYTTGKKQTYYLNSIETRSHAAIFVKDIRLDGQSANQVQVPSLLLKDIYLMSKANYQSLTATYGLPNYSSGVDNLCMASSIQGGALSFINQNALKRISFGYSYDLCPGTLNSNTANQGKLTLNKLSVYGRNSAPVTPDYLFEYGNNPSYDGSRWDGWGMYNGSTANHKASVFDADGSAWSLTKITNPLGSQIQVNYERDTYATASGQTLFEGSGLSFGTVLNQTPETGFSSLSVVHNGYLATGDQVQIDASWDVTCPAEYVGFFSKTCQITNVNGNQVTFDSNMGVADKCTGTIRAVTYTGTIKKIVRNRKGGSLRVGSIVLSDGATQYKTRYLYTGDDGITSSGVVSQEPEYIKTQTFSFYDLPGYPQTPVMYGKVTVLDGTLSNDTDYHTKQVYKFETPSQSMVNYTREAPYDRALMLTKTVNLAVWSDLWTLSHHKLEFNISKIGRLNSVEMYDQSGLRSSSQLYYTGQPLNSGVNQYQGTYTGGTLIFDKVINTAGVNTDTYYRFSRTTMISYPNVLKKKVVTKDGMTSEVENLGWDFITGAVNEKIERSAQGVNIKTVTKPAYSFSAYSEFGPKASSLSNKNMLVQPGSEYTYKTDATGATIYGLVGGTAQTWSKNWSNYRVLNAGAYSDQAEGANVWRKGTSYFFKGDYSLKRTDGTLTFASNREFDYSTGASNPGWQYGAEIKRFDHFSMPLESVDMNQIPSSVKMGYGDQLKLAEAANASYTEFTFSGAEDLNSSTGYFGGEITPGAGSVVTNATHSGACALSLGTGYGFVYKPTGLKPNRTYRASVWSNSNNGRIYYKLNTGGTEQVSPAPTVQVNGWYLTDFQIPIGTSFNSLEVGVKSASGTVVVFDDFRFQPIDAGMKAYVYNTATGELQYVLDNNNLYTKYEYNERGLLVKTYIESVKFNGVKLVTETRDNYRRFNTNP